MKILLSITLLEKYFYHVVSQYKQNGEYVATFKSMKEAAEKTGTDYITLSNVCNGKTRIANGFQWKKGECKKNIPPVKFKNETTIYQYSDDGIFLKEWHSLKEISNQFERPQNTLSTSIKRGRAFEGFFWSKEKKEKLIFKEIGNGKKEISFI